MKKVGFLISTMLIAAVTIAASLAGSSRATAKEANKLVYNIKASNARLNRRVTGPVTDAAMGVPAEPVHSFVWDGNGSVVLKNAKAKLEIDPVSNTGEITAEWKDVNGAWTFFQSIFVPPHHPTGLRVGPSADATELIPDDPVTTDVYLHGNTGAGGPVLPTVFNLLATWGPAEVTLNGEPFDNPYDNPYDGPVPLWVAHTMTTVGVRDEEGTVRTVAGDIYDPMAATNGAVDYDDREFHLVFHEAPMPMTDNFPPPHSFFYHLTFEDVKVEIDHKE